MVLQFDWNFSNIRLQISVNPAFPAGDNRSNKGWRVVKSRSLAEMSLDRIRVELVRELACTTAKPTPFWPHNFEAILLCVFMGDVTNVVIVVGDVAPQTHLEHRARTYYAHYKASRVPKA